MSFGAASSTRSRARRRVNRGATPGWVLRLYPAPRRARGDRTASCASHRARVDLGWRQGKRVRKTYYGATRGAVAEQLTQAIRTVQDGATALGGRLSDGRSRTLQPVDRERATDASRQDASQLRATGPGASGPGSRPCAVDEVVRGSRPCLPGRSADDRETVAADLSGPARGSPVSRSTGRSSGN